MAQRRNHKSRDSLKWAVYTTFLFIWLALGSVILRANIDKPETVWVWLVTMTVLVIASFGHGD